MPLHFANAHAHWTTGTFRLPLPRLATHWTFFGLLAAVHLYLGFGHLAALGTQFIYGRFGDLETTWTHVWKGGGAAFGAYYFAALAAARLAARTNPHGATADGEFARRGARATISP